MANEAIHNSFPNICRKDYSVFDVKNGRAKKAAILKKGLVASEGKSGTISVTILRWLNHHNFSGCVLPNIIQVIL